MALAISCAAAAIAQPPLSEIQELRRSAEENAAKLGDCGLYPDWEDSPYTLPWELGREFLVSRTTDHFVRGNGGVGLYAIDVPMPIGTTIVAARGGRVVAVRDEFEDGNGEDLKENFVFVQHEDDTVARYFHLTHRGALLAVGEDVTQGQPIARSGNTGDSAGPVEPELFVDDPFEGCEGLAFNGEGRLFVACNRAVWEVLPNRAVRRATDTYSNLGLAPIGERDLVMADFGPTNVFTDGDAAALDGVVWRITPEGEKTSIATGIRDPNAVLVRPGGSLLVSDDGTDEIYLVAPTGDVSVFSRAVAYPNGLALSLDGRTLYVAQIFRQMGPIVPDNRVWAVPLDAAGYPADDAQLLAELGEEGLNDGVAVDALDRVYVAENAGGRVWRIDPVSGRRMVVAEGMPHVASLAFGRGAFGNTMLYATTTARGGGKVWRMEVGVKGAPLHR